MFAQETVKTNLTEQQKIPLMSLEEFINWYPDGYEGRFELHNGVIFKVQPAGTHEQVAGFLALELGIEIKRLNLPFFIPRQGLIKAILVYSLFEGEYRVNLFRGKDGVESPTFPEFNLTAEQIFEVGQ